MGDPLLASQGLHPGLHDRARLHGEAQARVRQAQHQDHRLEHRSGERPQELVKDIQETQGSAINYPMIGDADLHVAKLYDMIHPNASGGKRTAADNATIRSVFIIGPDKKVKAMLIYPMSAGRNFDEVLRLLDSLH